VSDKEAVAAEQTAQTEPPEQTGQTGPAAQTGPAGAASELLVITGMSGAGRSTAGDVLEDLGWYVVDNLPPQLVSRLVDLTQHPGTTDVRHLAVTIDVRGRSFFAALRTALAELADRGVKTRLLFLDAADEALVRRFESVRRPHPLQGEGRLLDGIVREREMLGELRGSADTVIDTSHLNVHQLSAKITEAYGDTAGPALRVTVMSFGFKYGLPLDADHVADVRFLPNPFWVPELRARTGLDSPVSAFVLGQQGAGEWLGAYVTALQPVLAGYLRENKRYVTVAVGCTGGKHRSVAMCEALAERLQDDAVSATTVHRDLGRE
jgi:UPF0042 nucleotide-binding protein